MCTRHAHTRREKKHHGQPEEDPPILSSSSEDPLEDDLEDENDGQRDPVFGQKPLSASSSGAADVLHLQPHHLLLQAAQCLGGLLLHLEQGIEEQRQALLGQLDRLGPTASCSC